MNRNMTLFILCVIVCSMGLLYYSNTATTPEPEVAAADPVASQSIPEAQDRLSTPLPSTPQRQSTGVQPQASGQQPGRAAPQSASGQMPQPGAQPQARVTTAQTSPLPRISDPAPQRTQEARTAPETKSGETKSETLPTASQPSSTAPAPGKQPAGTPQNMQQGAAASPVDAGRTPPRQAGQSGRTSPDASKPLKQPSSPEENTAQSGPAANKEPQAPLPLTGTHEMHSIVVQNNGGQVIIRVEATDPFPTKYFVLTDPDRLVVDLPGKWTGAKAPSIPANTLLKGVRIGNQPNALRLVFDLHKKPREHSVERQGNQAEIKLK